MRYKYKKFKELDYGDIFDFEGNRYIVLSPIRGFAREWGCGDLIHFKDNTKVLVKQFSTIM